MMERLSNEFNFEFLETASNEEFAVGLITFKTFMDCYVFCREYCQSVQRGGITFSHVWYFDYCGPIQTMFLQSIVDSLNDDCIEAIAYKLDLVGLSDFVRFKPELMSVARKRFANLVIDISSVGRNFGVMNLHYILTSIGAIVTNITISMRCFPGGIAKKWNSKLKYAILRCACDLAGPNLRTLTLSEFGADFQRIETMITLLNDKDITLNII